MLTPTERWKIYKRQSGRKYLTAKQGRRFDKKSHRYWRSLPTW